jgi:hypothetical protein
MLSGALLAIAILPVPGIALHVTKGLLIYF